MELTSLVIPLLLAAVAAWGAARRVDVYAALTDGAMDGLRVVLRICPNLIALLTAVYMFRASGALDLLTSLLAPALTALGIDPDQDERFIKEGVSALDALVAYGTAEGFKHLADGEADAMATEQGYYALTAYARYLMNLTRLYDMTDVFDAEAEKIEPLELYIGIAA